jgi:hypothetical protein
MKRDESPNDEIDSAIKDLMKRLKGKPSDTPVPLDEAVKVINAAISWEKVKHQIKDNEGFDPSAL